MQESSGLTRGHELAPPALSRRGSCLTLLPMQFRPTLALPWDDLDDQGCADDGAPDWHTLIIVGPLKRRDGHGHTTLEWTVTVQCRPHP